LKKRIGSILLSGFTLLAACSVFVHPFGATKEKRSDKPLLLDATFDFRVVQIVEREMSISVRNRVMPLPRYLLLHPEPKLSDAEVTYLYQWARSERKRLKAAAAEDASISGGNQ
jgi:hypothetical protein